MRVDSGIVEGDTVGGAFDSLLAKLIVTGAHPRSRRSSASRRALDEFVVDGMATAIPFHRAVVADPAFAPADADAAVHGPHPLDRDRVRQRRSRPYAGAAADGAEAPAERETRRRRGRRQAPRGRRCPPGSALGGGGAGAAEDGTASAPAAARPARPRSGDSLTAPMQGTIVKVAVEEGEQVAEGDLVVVLEAMKMEQPLTAHKAGTITGLAAEVGATVTTGAVICEIKDA